MKKEYTRKNLNKEEQRVFLIQAIKNGEYEGLKKLFEKYSEIDPNIVLKVDRTDKFFYEMSCYKEITPLMLILASSKINREQKRKMALYLLENKNIDVNLTRSGYGETPLTMSIENFFYDVFEKLIDRGAYINIESGFSFLPMMVAKVTKEEDYEIYEKMIIKILELRLERMSPGNIRKEVESAIKYKETRDISQVVGDLLNVNPLTRHVNNDIKNVSHLYSLWGEMFLLDGSKVNLEGWGNQYFIKDIEALLVKEHEICEKFVANIKEYYKESNKILTERDVFRVRKLAKIIIKNDICAKCSMYYSALNAKEYLLLILKNTEHETLLAKKIKEKIALKYLEFIKNLDEGEYYSINTGFKKHAIITDYKRMKNGNLLRVLSNLGEGTFKDQRTNENKIKPYIEILDKNISDKKMLKNLEEEIEMVAMNINEYSEKFYKERIKFFEGNSEKVNNYEVSMREQVVGNCIFKSAELSSTTRIYDTLKRYLFADKNEIQKISLILKNIIKQAKRDYAEENFINNVRLKNEFYIIKYGIEEVSKENSQKENQKIIAGKTLKYLKNLGIAERLRIKSLKTMIAINNFKIESTFSRKVRNFFNKIFISNIINRKETVLDDLYKEQNELINFLKKRSRYKPIINGSEDYKYRNDIIIKLFEEMDYYENIELRNIGDRAKDIFKDIFSKDVNINIKKPIMDPEIF